MQATNSKYSTTKPDMDYYLKAQEKSLESMETMIDENQERLVRNGGEVKRQIQAAFGQYISWLRDREAELLYDVDKLIQSHLRRSQSSICETLTTLNNFCENVGLLDRDELSKDVKNQIDTLLKDMTSAVQSDMKTSIAVRFDDNGKSVLKKAIECCGEVFAESTEVPSNGTVVATSTSKWSKWLQSTNFDLMEEPDLMGDFGCLGTVQTMLSHKNKTPLKSNLKTGMCCSGASCEKTAEPVVTQKESSHGPSTFENLMKRPMEEWLKPKHVDTPRAVRTCPSKTGPCANPDPNVEIENLGQLKCVTNVPTELKNWLMQPDVVQLPPVADICQGNTPCQKLSECASPSHCIGYFFNLSRRSEDWLVPPRSSPMKCSVDLFDTNGSSRHTTPAASVKSFKSDEFEVLSNVSSTFTRDILANSGISCVSDDLKLWLMSSAEPSVDESEWLTIQEDSPDKPKKFHSTTRIEDWLMTY